MYSVHIVFFTKMKEISEIQILQVVVIKISGMSSVKYVFNEFGYSHIGSVKRFYIVFSERVAQS
jgi:hypothetical protein